jgi:D-amino-acid dehydrogenase
VVVIGAGVIGTCVALYLARQGAAVTLADRLDPGSGASSGNAGLVVPSHVVPLNSTASVVEGLSSLLSSHGPIRLRPRRDRALVRWCWRFLRSCNPTAVATSTVALHAFAAESLELHKALAASIGGYGFEQRGWLHLYRSRRAMESGMRTSVATSQVGVLSRQLSAADARRMAQVTTDNLMGGIFFPNDAQLQPLRFVQELVRTVRSAGVRVLSSASIGLRREEHGKVSAVDSRTGEVIKADTCVLAAGSASASIGRTVGLDIPIEPARGFSFTVQPDRAVPLPLSLDEAHVVVTPMGDRVRVTSGLDLVGLDSRIESKRIQAVEQAAKSYLGLDVAMGEPWIGYRPLTPDCVPIVGRSTRYRNLVIASGHGTLGVTLAPATGNLVADIVSGRPLPAWTEAVRPARFGI